MQQWFDSGHIVDAIIALMAIETVLLVALRRRVASGPSPASLILMIAAGLFLLIALRGALTGAPWPMLALALFAALIAHLADLWRRWKELAAAGRAGL